MNEDAYVSDEEELECPLCMEEFDISDRTFKPCPCGYQICRFCYNRIVNSESANGCPACRRKYTEETVEFKPLSAEEWKKDQQRIQSRKLKEKEKRESEMASRRHLSNMRVVQKNLVYVIGFSPKSADADLAATLRGNDYFAQYGKINKIVVNKKSHPNGQPTVGVYITYARKEDAARAVQAVDNTINDGRVLRASFGTTKYCSAYLRQQVCQNPNCMYLHEPGEDLDSYTREDMSTIQHAAKAAEGMHANALAAHHMRRQPTRTDSMGTTGAETEASSAALPPTASWASVPKPGDAPAGTSSPQLESKKPEFLPPARGKETQGEIPPPPSQALQNSVQPSELLPAPVQPGLNHPILGSTIQSLFEGRFKFNFVPRVMPGLSEADIKSAETFPQLFAWNPQPRRPTSPSKTSKNHARSGSRYAFAAESSKTPPPGFVPPGLATGLQPPGFSGNAQSNSKDGSADFFSQFLKNSNPQDAFNASNQAQAGFEDPAILGLRESMKSSTDLVFNSQNDLDVAPPPGISSDVSSAPWMPVADDALPAFSPFSSQRKSLEGRKPSIIGPSLLEAPESEKQQSKFGASFARLEHLENQASEIAQKIDSKARSSWVPAPRPREELDKSSTGVLVDADVKVGQAPMHHHLAVPKSSGTWQPSPPPVPQVSPSPKPSATNHQRFGPSSFRSANKAPWEPSPPLTVLRTKSPSRNSQEVLRDTTIGTEIAELSSMSELNQPVLAQEDFPALGPARLQRVESNASMTHVSTKKQWDTITPGQPTKILARRDSTPSVISTSARSRQNSLTESTTSKVQTPGKVVSPTASPLSSRAASPILTTTTPLLNRTLSSAAPAVSSPLANLNTGKQIRILSTKVADDSRLKAEKQAAEERAIAKMKEDELAAAAKIVRKSVPATSIKKSKEQKQQEQREKAEKRERESLASSLAEDRASAQEIAPIMGRARKQKTPKQVKTPVKPQKPVKVESTVVEQLSEQEQEQESEEEAGEEQEVVASDAAKVAASDAISELSRAVNLRDYAFFKPVPSLNHNYHLTSEEISKAMELAQWPAYAGKETVEQLESLLSQARKEATEQFKVLEKLQKRNIRLARLDLAIPT